MITREQASDIIANKRWVNAEGLLDVLAEAGAFATTEPPPPPAWVAELCDTLHSTATRIAPAAARVSCELTRRSGFVRVGVVVEGVPT